MKLRGRLQSPSAVRANLKSSNLRTDYNLFVEANSLLLPVMPRLQSKSELGPRSDRNRPYLYGTVWRRHPMCKVPHRVCGQSSPLPDLERDISIENVGRLHVPVPLST